MLIDFDLRFLKSFMAVLSLIMEDCGVMVGVLLGISGFLVRTRVHNSPTTPFGRDSTIFNIVRLSWP